MLKVTVSSSLPTLHTPRLTLYPLTHEIVVRQLAGQPFTLDLPELGPSGKHVQFDVEWPGDAFAIFASLAENTQVSGGWVMIQADEAVGMIGPKGQLWGAVEIGYGLRPQNWREGLATGAVVAVSAWLLTLEQVRGPTRDCRNRREQRRQRQGAGKGWLRGNGARLQRGRRRVAAVGAAQPSRN